MMAGNLFRLQLAEALGNRRLVILRIAVAALLSLPFILIAMPARAQAGGIVMVILFTSFFGAAVSFARLSAETRLERLMLLPVSHVLIWLDLVLSSALIRLIPAALVLMGFIAVNGKGIKTASLINIAGMLCLSLLLLTLLGMGAGRLSRSNGEVHLFGAIICIILAVVSGITPLPERLKFLSVTTTWNPIARLLTALTELADGNLNITGTELIFESMILIALVTITLQRWISGGLAKQKA
jgi:hypothetical protein